MKKRRITKRVKRITKSPSWRDDCVKLLRDIIANETEIAKSSYSEFNGIGHPLLWNDKVWKRNDPEGFALVRRARALIKRATTLRIEIFRR